MLSEKIDISNHYILAKLVNVRPFLGPQLHSFYKISSRSPHGQIELKQISILTKSQLPTPSLRPKNVPKTTANLVDLSRPPPIPFITPKKIKELNLLTYIFVKSATRRFLWCNSQLLIRKISQENSRFMFLLGKAFSGTHRLR